MSTTTNANVVGVFDTQELAVEAVRGLLAANFAETEIGLISPPPGQKDESTETVIEEGMGIGAAAGGLGGLGLGLAVAAGVIPPLGPVIVGGTLAALLASTLGGAAAGTVVGGLIGLGFSEEDIGLLDEQLRAGKTLVTVRAPRREEEAVRILEVHGFTLTPTPMVS
jgi:hypothetical protein